jgi:hypothetical protein
MNARDVLIARCRHAEADDAIILGIWRLSLT